METREFEGFEAPEGKVTLADLSTDAGVLGVEPGIKCTSCLQRHDDRDGRQYDLRPNRGLGKTRADIYSKK